MTENFQLLSNVLKTYETETLVSKYRSAEADSAFDAHKNKIYDEFVNQFKAKNNLRGFISNSDNQAKLRSVISDATCESAICAGVVELYKECNPNIFELMPNFTEIPCEGRKPVKFGRKGRYATFAPSTTLSALTNFTDLTTALDTEILLDCVQKTPKVVEGMYNTKMSDLVCGDTLKFVCFTVDTLSQLEQHLTISAQFEAIKYLKSVANAATTAPTGTLKDIIRELINDSNTGAGNISSSYKMLFVNRPIIERMAMETYSQGSPVFPNLKLECGSLYCDIFCLDGVTKVVVLPDNILPKVANKYQLLLTKADQLDAGSSSIVSGELSNDIAMLLNGNKNKVAGYKPYMIEEISQFAGKTTYVTSIS
jgi:hypothetical protein